MKKNSDAGLVALEGIIEQDRWSSHSSTNSQTAGAFRAGYPQTHLLPLFQKSLNALIQETIQRPFRAFKEVEVRKTDRP